MRVGKNFAFNRILNNNEIYVDYNAETATYKGIGIKTSLLLGITFLVTLAMIGTVLTLGGLPIITYIIALILNVVLSIIISFSPLKARTLAIPYAISEGLMLGCLCGLLELAFPNEGLVIAGTALLITVSVFIGALILYSTGFIKVGRRFVSFFISIAIGVGIFMIGFLILSLVLRLTSNINLIDLYYDSNIAMILSVILCVIAGCYVVMSLSEADEVVKYGYEKTYEWYAAFAIAINVIYLFLEVLRLLIIIFARNRRD